jgi:hypothetical protein
MRLPKPVLPDADGDGITDQFDQEQTPSGVPVDSHGVSRDTDGDGVPDARDKEWLHQHIASRLMQMALANAPARKVVVHLKAIQLVQMHWGFTKHYLYRKCRTAFYRCTRPAGFCSCPPAERS